MEWTSSDSVYSSRDSDGVLEEEAEGGLFFRCSFLVFEEETFSADFLRSFGFGGEDRAPRVRVLTGANFSLLDKEASSSPSSGGSLFKSPRPGGGDVRGFLFKVVGVTGMVDFRARDFTLLPDPDAAMGEDAGGFSGSAECFSDAADECSSDEAGTFFFEGPLGFFDTGHGR